MNPSQDVTSETQRSTDSSAGPGRRLRELRESRGIEIERVIAQLHLQRDVVESLEQDRYEGLPPPVFVAGYLKSYARLLGTDPEPIVSAYRATVQGTEHQLASPRAQAPKGKSSGALTWILILTLIAAGAAGGYFWWQGQPRPSQQDAEQPADTAVTEKDGEPPATADASAATAADEESADSATRIPAEAIPLRRQEPTPPPEPESKPSAPEPQETGQPPAASAPTIPAAPAAPAADEAVSAPKEEASESEPSGPPEVALEFTGTTWVDVRDAKGKVVLNGEMREGDRRILSGEPPYKFVIGNAAATRMTIGGQGFDLEKRARGNVARFSLDPADPQ